MSTRKSGSLGTHDSFRYRSFAWSARRGTCPCRFHAVLVGGSKVIVRLAAQPDESGESTAHVVGLIVDATLRVGAIQHGAGSNVLGDLMSRVRVHLAVLEHKSFQVPVD